MIRHLVLKRLEQVVARNRRRGLERGPTFVQVFTYAMDTDAWYSLSGSAVKVYLEIKRHFNGNNNGHIAVSVRMIKAKTGFQLATITRALKELQAKGFLVLTQGGHLGVDGHGLASTWRLTELPTTAGPPTRDFASWSGPARSKPKRKPPTKIQKPVPKIGNVVPLIETGPSH